MRKTVIVLVLCCAAALSAAGAETGSMTPDALLQRGLAGYRAGNYSDAAVDLDAAAKALLSQEQMQNYVNTGKFPSLDKLETALVYLTLAQTKLGHEDQAREAVQRLLTAERIESRYAQLPLGTDAAEFERVAARLVPGTDLAHGGTKAPTTAPAPVIVQAPPLAPTPPPTPPVAQQAPPAPPPAATAPPRPPVQSADERERMIEERLAQERAKFQKEADERIAAIQRAADERIAAIQKEAEARIAAIQAMNRRSYITTLRQADDYAANGQLSRANDIYSAIALAADAPREIIAEAGVGLYRTGAYRDAAAVFRKLGPLVRGEEDLRYYNAVSLFETGSFAAAKKELACALPYLEVTGDVSRYRDKIEASAR